MTAETFDDIAASEATDAEVSYEIKRWQSDEWEELEGDKRIVHYTQPNWFDRAVHDSLQYGRKLDYA